MSDDEYEGGGDYEEPQEEYIREDSPPARQADSDSDSDSNHSSSHSQAEGHGESHFGGGHGGSHSGGGGGHGGSHSQGGFGGMSAGLMQKFGKYAQTKVLSGGSGNDGHDSRGYQATGAGHNPGVQQQYAPPPPPMGQIKHQADQGDQQGFHYSSCTGRRKALLIGINYFGQGGELAGCINDVHNVRNFIMQRFNYKAEDIVILTDDSRDPRMMPTKDNIIRGMQWLVENAQPNDALFLHYSGHGTQVEDVNGDEGDDDDEAICPLDYEQAGLIIDDDSDHRIVVTPLPEGCRLTAIFDSCHYGTVMDLPYIYTTDGKIKGPDFFTTETTKDLMGGGMSLLSGDTHGAMGKFFGAAKGMFGAHQADAKGKKNKSSAADVVMWSGCKDDQTSADTQEAGKATGAMSYAFIAALTKYPQQSYMQLLNTVRDEMRGKYEQKPQLSASHPIDTDLEFIA